MEDVTQEYVMEDDISNMEIVDLPDGSGILTMDMSDEMQVRLMKQGLQYMIDEMRLHDKVEVLEPNEFSAASRTWELSDDDFNVLLHFGVIAALKSAMDK